MEKPFLERVSFFIDGFNVYHRIKDFCEVKGLCFKWLNYRALFESLLEKGQKIQKIYFFTAIDEKKDQGVKKRHQAFIDALDSVQIEVISGKFAGKHKERTEKQTDINLSLQVFEDASKDDFDLAYLMTADSDQVPTLKKFKKNFPTKRISCIIPPFSPDEENQKLRMVNMEELLNECNFPHKTIYFYDLAKYLFPSVIKKDNDRKIFRPPEYRKCDFDFSMSIFQTKKSLNGHTVEQFLSVLTDPKASEEEIAALTAAWKAKGETSDELAAIAEYILKKLDRVDTPFDVIDCCGTGGDNSGTFNVSTTSAVLAACAGVKVAKHGGRKTTSASGSIDLLEALGASTFVEPEKIKQSLEKIGLAFIASPALHGMLGRWKNICRKLNFAGQTGLIGTLTNPVHLTHQVIGVPKPEWGPLMIEALKKLGRKQAIVVHGKPKLDEASLCGLNQLWILQNDQISEKVIDPKDFGLKEYYSLDELRGGEPKENAEIFLKLIKGEAPKAIFETVLLNTGLMLWLYGKSGSIECGMQMVKNLVASGEALRFWENFIAETKKLKKD